MWYKIIKCEYYLFYLIWRKSADTTNLITKFIVADVFIDVRDHNFTIVGGFHFDFSITGMAVVYHLSRHLLCFYFLSYLTFSSFFCCFLFFKILPKIAEYYYKCSGCCLYNVKILDFMFVDRMCLLILEYRNEF